MHRPLIAAGLAFLAGSAAGSLSAAPAAFVLALGLIRRRALPIALALFALAGAMAAETGPRPVPLLDRGTWILEGDLAGVDADRAELDLAGAGPPGARIDPRVGRILLRGPVEPCRPGDRARILANARTIAPFGFPGERAGPPHSVASVRRCVTLRSSPSLVPLDRLRRRMRAAVDRALGGERAAVVKAMAIGDRVTRHPDLRSDFSDAGLSHLLVVSGQHLSIVSSLFTVLLAGLFARIGPIRDRWGARRPSALAALVFVVAYTLLVGAAPSSVRAAVMVSVMLIGQLADRRREAWSALGLAAVLMIALEPEILPSLSFQLSFAAVAGLLLLQPPLSRSRWIRRCPRALRAIAAVIAASLAATLGTAPLLAWHFGRISVVGLLANVPAAPLVALFLLPASLVGSLAAAISEPLGRPILIAAGWGAQLLIELARYAAAVPGATASVSAPEMVLLAAALAAGLVFRRIRVAALLAAALVLVLALERRPEPPPEELVLTALPVGQGTAVLVETPEGARILLDTGPPDTVERVLLPYLRHRRIDRLDLVVLSHPHADHTGGFSRLARRVEIREVWINGDLRDAAPDLSGHRARTVTATVTALGALRIEVIQSRADAARVNDGSIVLRLVHGRRRILFTGDAERAAEAELLASGQDLSADILVVGHHGSNSSTGEALLDAVRPSIAVIPVGRDNAFRHPHPAVLERLERAGARVLRTDRDGAVTVRTDGERLGARAHFSPPSR